MRPELEQILDGICAALNWWLDGLWAGLPPTARQALFAARDELEVRLSGSRVNVTSSTGAPVSVDSTDTAAVTAARAELARKHEPDVTLVLDRTRVLTHTLKLPAVASSDLRSLLFFELDRLTPFAADDVAFDFRVRTRSDDGLVVDVALARRTALDAAIKAVEPLGLRPTAVTIEDADGARLPFNLLLRHRRLRLPAARLTVRPALAIGAVLMLVMALYLPLARYQSVLGEQRSAVESVRTEAVAARGRLAEQEASLARADFLAAKRRDYVPPVALLKDLTVRIPQHTWVSRFAISRGEVQLQGESGTATELLQILEASDLLEHAQFQAPVARADDTGKEQFTIVAALTRRAR